MSCSTRSVHSKSRSHRKDISVDHKNFLELVRLGLLQALGAPGKQVAQMVSQFLLGLPHVPLADTVLLFPVGFLTQIHHSPLFYLLWSKEDICQCYKRFLCCSLPGQSTAYKYSIRALAFMLYQGVVRCEGALNLIRYQHL